MTDQSDQDPIIDVELALTYTAGDREMLISIAELFLEEGPKQLQEVQRGVEQGDQAQTSKAAHTLKGSINIFGARAAAAAAAELELAAAAGDDQRTKLAWQTLNHEMRRLVFAVEELCRA